MGDYEFGGTSYRTMRAAIRAALHWYAYGDNLPDEADRFTEHELVELRNILGDARTSAVARDDDHEIEDELLALDNDEFARVLDHVHGVIDAMDGEDVDELENEDADEREDELEHDASQWHTRILVTRPQRLESHGFHPHCRVQVLVDGEGVDGEWIPCREVYDPDAVNMLGRRGAFRTVPDVEALVAAVQAMRERYPDLRVDDNTGHAAHEEVVSVRVDSRSSADWGYADDAGEHHFADFRLSADGTVYGLDTDGTWTRHHGADEETVRRVRALATVRRGELGDAGRRAVDGVDELAFTLRACGVSLLQDVTGGERAHLEALVELLDGVRLRCELLRRGWRRSSGFGSSIRTEMSGFGVVTRGLDTAVRHTERPGLRALLSSLRSAAASGNDKVPAAIRFVDEEADAFDGTHELDDVRTMLDRVAEIAGEPASGDE